METKKILNTKLSPDLRDRILGRMWLAHVEIWSENLWNQLLLAGLDPYKWNMKNYPSKIYLKQSKNMSFNSLVNIAKKTYLIGSVFKDLVNKEPFTVKSHSFDNFGGVDQLYVRVKPHRHLPNKTARIYKDGVWANVVVNVKKKEIPKLITIKKRKTIKYTEI